jgi:hypothetical protein
MSQSKSELLRIAEALERLITVLEHQEAGWMQYISTLSASPPSIPGVPSVPTEKSHAGSTSPLVKRPSSEFSTPPGDTLDDALTNYNEHLRVTKNLTGRLEYAMKTFTKDKSVWVAINDVMKAHGMVWISAGKQSHWEAKPQ